MTQYLRAARAVHQLVLHAEHVLGCDMWHSYPCPCPSPRQLVQQMRITRWYSWKFVELVRAGVWVYEYRRSQMLIRLCSSSKMTSPSLTSHYWDYLFGFVNQLLWYLMLESLIHYTITGENIEINKIGKKKSKAYAKILIISSRLIRMVPGRENHLQTSCRKVLYGQSTIYGSGFHRVWLSQILNFKSGISRSIGDFPEM